MGHVEHIHATDSTDRHQVDIFSALLAFNEGNSPVTGEFPSQKPEARSFDAFLEQRLSKLLNQTAGMRWFETPSRSL